jgi:uncharacterized protein (DUF1800 family)
VSTDRATIAHLYRRAGFGATPSEVSAGAAAGYEKTVDMLLAGLRVPDSDVPRLPHLSTIAERNAGMGNSYEEYTNLVAWWLEKMARTTTPLREKLTLLLHGQFPVGFDKVGVPIYMHRQNQIFRTAGAGPFDELTQALATDPSMIIWLDLGSNQRLAPNENFARELMERFTMGIGNYSQRDVRESARALTGWTVSYQSGAFDFVVWDHDYGEKSFLGHKGDLAGQDIVRIVTHSSASARWVPSRMWSFLAYPVGTRDPVVSSLAPGYASDLNMTNLLSAILKHPDFLSTDSRQGLVKQPAEWVAGLMRTFGLGAESFKKVGGAGYLLNVMTNLGQIPFNPPTVGGWGNNEFWLSSASSLAQLDFAQNVVEVADLSPIEEAAGASRVDALGELLSIDSWSSQSNAVLQRTRDNVPKLVALALTAPETIAN